MDSLTMLLQSARMYDLEQPRFQGAPCFTAHQPGFVLNLHRRHERGLGEARTSASGMITQAEHSGTHIDALCHQALNMRLHGGVEVDADVQTSRGFTQQGVESLEPIIARAVMLDVPAALNIKECPQKSLVTVDMLLEAVRKQDATVNAGDVLLVRTGNGQHWRDTARYEAGPGLDTAASRWCASQGVKAVGSDNLAWDLSGYRDPEMNVTLPGHVVLMVESGIFIMENLNLEALAADNVYSMTFICVPLKIQGGTGSPVRPLAFL